MIRLTTALLLACLILFTPLTLLSQEEYLRVTARGRSQLPVVIAQPLPTGGEQDRKVAADIADILKFDLGMTGMFDIMSQQEAEGAAAAIASAGLLISTRYTVSPTAIVIDYRLQERSSGREVLAKRYSSAPQDMRKTAHTFADDIMQNLSGERGPFTGKIAYVSTATGNKEIYLMDWDGYNVRKLTSNGSINLNPEFSSSGRELIFTSYKKGNPDLYRRELFTGLEARISSASGINITGAFSPDGEKIALAMSKEGNSEIYLIAKDGKQLARLTNNRAIDLSPTWSPDGRYLAFVSDRYGKPQIFVMRVDGSDVRRLTMTGSYNVSPRWSPGGDKLVYCRQYGSKFQIHTINPDGSDDHQITTEGNNEHPRWSPDGRFIVFSSKRGGAESVFVMRADGSGQTKISRSSAKDSHPTWSSRW